MTNHYKFCTLEKRDHIWIVTINRPDALNALHPPTNYELESVFNDFDTDKNAWVAILTGAGNQSFSVGHDLKYQASGAKVTIPKTGFAGLTARFDLDKPVIAAVNGFAMGGGFEIALACDLIVADQRAQFALPEPRVGLAALAGGIHRLSRQIGQKQAMDMLLTARKVGAEEGQRMGFVNRIVSVTDNTTVVDEAVKVAEQMILCSPVSLQMTKQMQRQGADLADLETAVSYRYEAIDTLLSSNDFIEGPAAFAEKRAPKWSGS
ncbi:Carnitinyl-CoA dehydratase [Sinobacterium norvegicum]|uniref:Carnitinyl-CoA dehydratase n=1 Tax=Sinobacterium norvegicum TaxID=1641715 RepID=A0ABN8EIA8_9GAMM|nr:enoyl-CoA hydratase-related protein [Sinobacterium norvegicum]CAH0992120.1 Carnitinyl-CoA dehydratase [Sinobacterium norvegicum]